MFTVKCDPDQKHAVVVQSSYFMHLCRPWLELEGGRAVKDDDTSVVFAHATTDPVQRLMTSLFSGAYSTSIMDHTTCGETVDDSSSVAAARKLLFDFQSQNQPSLGVWCLPPFCPRHKGMFALHGGTWDAARKSFWFPRRTEAQVARLMLYWLHRTKMVFHLKRPVSACWQVASAEQPTTVVVTLTKAADRLWFLSHTHPHLVKAALGEKTPTNVPLVYTHTFPTVLLDQVTSLSGGLGSC